MNINDLKNFIDDVLNNPEKIGDVSTVMEKALSIYKELSEMFVQATPEERERIQASLKEMGTVFDKKFEEIAKQMGLTKEELLEAMQDESNYSDDVWSTVQNFQTEIRSEKKQLASKLSDGGGFEEEAPKRKAVKSKRKKTWVSA